jgi:hypothetical protein
MVVITICLMTYIPSAIQVPSFLDKDKMDEVEAVRILMMMNTKLWRLY